MNILDMEPDAFEGALQELGLEPEREQFLRDEYAKKNTVSGQMLGAFQSATAVPEGKERASVLPMIKPEGMSGIEAIRRGQAELAAPGMLTGSVEEPMKAMTTAEKVNLGIDASQEELQQAAQMGAMVGTLGAGIKPNKASKLFSKKVPPEPVSKPKLTFNNTLFDEADFESLGDIPAKPKKPVYKEDLEAEINLMLGEELTPEEGLARLKKSNEESLSSPEDSILGNISRQKDKLFSSLKDEELFKLAEDLPHWEDSKYQDYIDNVLVPIAQYQGVEKGSLLELVNDISAYLPPKENPQLANLAEKPLPKKAPIGERAAKEGKPRPSDAKAEALNFKDTVYHTSVSPKEFTKFELGHGFIGETKAAQDLLGVHVGTARAAAERNFQAVRSNDTPQGFTMELRARTTDPVTKEDLAKMFGYKAEDIFSEGKTPLTEGDLSEAINIYEDMLFAGKDRPENARELAAVAFRRELAREGYTHIPYINNVEDAGSTSMIMLVDRPKDSAAVLRDVRAKFDPKKITNPDLRFAEGGMVEDDQMNRLMAEGGMADDGMAIEPTTGNEVPPGSLAKEVRDDIDAKLSEGEYIVPADVVRYFGVRFFEDLRMQAKQGLSQMDAQGRIGGTAVDANGIPMQEEDSLSPEEEQMLMEALGSAPAATGMAKGGDVSQNPAFGKVGFDRKKFTIPASSGFEMRVYYNPTTGEKKAFQVMNGSPIGAIPEGFVPYVEGMENQPIAPVQTPATPVTQPTTNVPSVNSGGSGGGNSGGSGAPSGGNSGGSGAPTFDYSSWADKNREAIKSDPYQFGLDALTDKSGKLTGKAVAIGGVLANAAVPGMVIGSGISQANRIQDIAEAKAALIEMKAQGKVDTKEYQNLSKQINSAIDDLPLASQFLVENEIVASASGYTKALNNPNVSPSTRSGTTPPTGGTAATPAVTAPTPPTQGTGGSTTPVRVPITTASNGSGKSSDVTYSALAPTSSQRPQSRSSTTPTPAPAPAPAPTPAPAKSESYKATQEQIQKSKDIASGKTAAAGKSYSSKGGYSSGRAEGGLVKKSAKPRTKGLASK